MKPMLARAFNASLIKWPGFVQPKLNGLRAMWLHEEEVLLSRDQHVWNESVLPHVFEGLRQLTEHIKFFFSQDTCKGIDGEIYCHGMSLQQINSRGSVNRKSPHADYGKLKFNVFDVVSLLPQEKRFEFLDYLAGQSFPGIEEVPTHLCHSQEEFDRLYDLYLNKERYEGVMWRDRTAPYGFDFMCGNKENRWNTIVKRKPRQDLVARILNRVEGEGKHAGMVGAFVCQLDDGKTFNVGSGLSDAQRRQIWDMPLEKVVGVPLRIDYEVLSDGGIPLKPTIACVELLLMD